MGAAVAMKFEPADKPDGPWPRDPLIAAVVWKLPQRGSFPADERAAWLRMMATAFDVTYGPTGGNPLHGLTGEAGPPPSAEVAPQSPPSPAKVAHAGHNFYIAADGTACNAAGEPVLIGDIPEGEMIFDYRPVTGEFRDRDGITWADGGRGVTGIASGISFCGPG